MSPFKYIAVIGGTGYLGKVVTERLIAASFKTTIITRNATIVKFVPGGTEVRTADYDSLESLTEAFRGFDVVVNTVPGHLEDLMSRILAAAVAARVTRYFPSEFGLDHRVPAAQTNVLAAPKIKAHAALAAAADSGEIEYTSLVGGSWIEFLLKFEGAMPVKLKKFYLHDGGDTPFGMTTRAAFGDAVVGALRSPVESRNKILSIEVINITQNKILDILRGAFPEAGFEIIHVNTTERSAQALQKLFSGDASLEVIQTLALQYNFDLAYHPLAPENELLGVKRITEEDFRDIAVSIAAER